VTTPTLRKPFRWIPATRIGRWTVGLLVAHIVAMLVFFLLALTRDIPSESFFDPPELAISLLLGAGAAVATTIVGAISIFRRIDRSSVVVLAFALSCLPTFFFLGELLSVVGVIPSH
jgi:hypothetical protein